ncbi:MAG TPA: TetR/AcrR family transcriptional regulator [Sporichthyaceae bacterium]|jgi:AcrR family transcriptional regulator
MPKVSQEHRDARREQILAGAKRCFLRNGFQATSMQDLFAESQLSSGSFYRYFTSKEDVILAIAEENLGAVTSLIHELATGRHEGGLGEALSSVLGTVVARNRDDQLGAMAVLVWSEALRSPPLRERFTDLLGRIREDLTELVGREQSAHRLPSDVDAAALAKLFLAIVPGAVLQLALFGERDLDGVPAAARAVWST